MSSPSIWLILEAVLIPDQPGEASHNPVALGRMGQYRRYLLCMLCMGARFVSEDGRWPSCGNKGEWRRVWCLLTPQRPMPRLFTLLRWCMHPPLIAGKLVYPGATPMCLDNMPALRVRISDRTHGKEPSGGHGAGLSAGNGV